MNKEQNFKFVSPRADVEIHLSDGKIISGPRGGTLEEFFSIYQDKDLPPIVGATVNGKLSELSYPVTMDVDVHPITMRDADGMRFYRRSLTFLLESAFEELFPNSFLTIDHSVSSGGYYCQVFNRAPLSEELISRTPAK